MKQKNNTEILFPPIIEWMERGFEKLYERARKFHKKTQQKSKNNKLLKERGEQDDADASTASYIAQKKQTQKQRLTELRARRKDRSKTQQRSL